MKITFHGGGSDEPRTLYYFSTDISDDGFGKNGFGKFCQGLAPGNSLVKSASYLMHKSYFSQVRGFLLENSNTLVQDPSGIPVTFLTEDQWNLRPFGNYVGPISLFSEHSQPKMFELYRKGDPVPLDFGIGYRHRKGESTLLVAERRPRDPGRRRPQGGAGSQAGSQGRAGAQGDPGGRCGPDAQGEPGGAGDRGGASARRRPDRGRNPGEPAAPTLKPAAVSAAPVTA